jgi:hypothetical protein
VKTDLIHNITLQTKSVLTEEKKGGSREEVGRNALYCTVAELFNFYGAKELIPRNQFGIYSKESIGY